jgi:hypothetical protein
MILDDFANIVNALNPLNLVIKQTRPCHSNSIRRQTQVGVIVLRNNRIGLDPTALMPVLFVLIMLHLLYMMERIDYR